MTATTHLHTPLSWTEKLRQSRGIDWSAMSFFLEEINPLWSLQEPRARIREVREETPDCKSFVLKPGWGWRGFAPGQHIGVGVQIHGVWHQRRYSICESKGRKGKTELTIAVKREPGGLVSNWLNDNAQAGDVVRLTQAAGDFVLPSSVPEKILMLAAGSGITPIMAQVRQLLDQAYTGEIALLHYVRSAQDRIFLDDLQALSQQHSNLQVHWCLEHVEGQAPQRFSPAQLAQLVPDYQERHTMLCGPAGFMQAIRTHWDELTLNEHIQFEYFGMVPSLKPADADPAIAGEIKLNRSGRMLSAKTNQPLLLALEEAGEKPAYGCRQGVCQSCKCRKTSGTVRNLITGQVSREPEQDIQLCISAAESDVVLQF